MKLNATNAEAAQSIVLLNGMTRDVAKTNAHLQRTNASLAGMHSALGGMQSDIGAMARKITHAKLLF